jgi:hypothetical protein
LAESFERVLTLSAPLDGTLVDERGERSGSLLPAAGYSLELVAESFERVLTRSAPLDGTLEDVPGERTSGASGVLGAMAAYSETLLIRKRTSGASFSLAAELSV